MGLGLGLGFSMHCATCCMTESSATLVLPAPVGAHTSMFSLE